ncbi:ribokinase [Chthonobacter rhizosphaerae]|uniref:ribokinase n=1 Tax=Chthonobacter rhizosphaerae TaxID=2735553 RepID=UPI0015EF5F91|nr:ribokinase [Chthonobacter rhizosphaerae]
MIVVFGSINVDLVTAVPRLPGPGETVKGPGYRTFPGGKGANQALAARRAGASVAMVGAVGDDGFRAEALSLLDAAGVDLSGVAAADAPTGIALIAVDERAENQIVVASGANALADPAGVASRIGAGDWLLLQFEVPDAAVLAAAEAAKRAGARVILNAAPAGPVPTALAALLDVLIVNEHEAAEVAASAGLPDEPKAFAAAWAARTGGACVVTLGAEGAFAASGGETVSVAPPAVTVVDTTAAGDGFVGAFAAALDRGASLADALLDGVAAGSLAVEAAGAQPSLPGADAIRARAAGLKATR